MESKELSVYKAIVRDMSEGVLTICMNGKIASLNRSAEAILGMGSEIIGQPFGGVFFSDEANDGFCQCILDAVYENSTTVNRMCLYVKPDGTRKQLFMNTSYLREDDEKIGVTAVINDITELAELRDALKAMEKIKALNSQLEKRNEFIKKTFGRYLSDDIVNTILETENGLEIGGKKQNVAIMFTDIRGFTALSEKMAPKDLITMLNAYLEKMIEVVIKHNGTILEFIGDAIVAVFGAPLENENCVSDAVECALEMQSKMPMVNEYNRRNNFIEIEMGIGIHAGEVVVGNIGSAKKTKYDIIGKNVNLASRIEGYSVGGQVLVSPEVKTILGEKLKTGREIAAMPKGVKNNITIYEALSCGEYSLLQEEQIFVRCPEKRILTCYPIDGKHGTDIGIKGVISEFSQKQFTLESETNYENNQSVRFTEGENEFFAKKIGVRNNLPLFHITSGKLNI